MTTNPYGHTRAAAHNTCTCGRTFGRPQDLTRHINHAYRTWANGKAAEEAGLRAEARARAIVTTGDVPIETAEAPSPTPVLVAEKDYRESLTFDEGDLFRAINKTFMASGLLVLVSVESAMDDTGHVTHTFHTKDEPGTWDLQEFELWAFFRSVANGELLDLASLVKRYAGTEIGLNIVATMMFLFFDPKGDRK